MLYSVFRFIRNMATLLVIPKFEDQTLVDVSVEYIFTFLFFRLQNSVLKLFYINDLIVSFYFIPEAVSFFDIVEV